MPTKNPFENTFDAQTPPDDEQLWELLSLYVDGEADPAQAALVEKMLKSDPAYARDFEFLMQTSKAVHTWEEVAPPAGLREAVYAKTVQRPTFVGWLRAAWTGAMQPATGRYATIGGAFAMAALLAVIAWPRLHPANNGSGLSNPANTVVALTPTPVTPEHTNLPSGPINIALPPAVKTPVKKETPTVAKADMHSVRPDVVKSPLNLPVPNPGAGMVKTQTPVNHPLNHYVPKSNAAIADAAQAPGYPYDKKMDDHSVHNLTPTVSASNVEFGPMVATNDDTATGTGHTVTTPTATMGSTGETATTTQPEAQPAPKRTVHVAALPPDARQNLAAAVIRQNISAKYSGYDRNVAENIQRREITIDVIKGTF